MPEKVVATKQALSARIFTKNFFVNAGINFILYINYYVLMVVMAGYCFITYQTDAATAGFVSSVFIVGALFARFLGGVIIDYFGRKRSLIAGTCIMSLCAFLYLINAGLPLLFLLRIVHGFAYGISQTAISSIATEAIPQVRKGEGVGYFMLSATLASAVGPFMGTVISEYVSYPVLFVICAIVTTMGFLLSFCVHDPRVPHLMQSRSSFAAQHAKSELTEKEQQQRNHLSLATFIEMRALPISCSIALSFLAYGSVITYLDSFALEQNLIEAASVFFIVYSIVMFISRPFTGKLFDKKGDLGVMIAGFCGFAIGMVCLGLAHSTETILLAAAFLGFGVGTINPCGLTLAVQKSPDSRLTAANSTFSCLNDATIGLAPVLLGWIIPLAGYNGLYLGLALIVLLAMALYLVFRHKGLIK